VIFEEEPPVLVAAESHSLNLGSLEGVHGYGSHKRDVHAQAAVNTGAREADEDAELGGGPLRARCAAVAADAILVFLLDREELRRSNKPTISPSPLFHLHATLCPRSGLSNIGQLALDRVSGSTSHMAFEAIVADGRSWEPVFFRGGE
jgi:hypothetical protein